MKRNETNQATGQVQGEYSPRPAEIKTSGEGCASSGKPSYSSSSSTSGIAPVLKTLGKPPESSFSPRPESSVAEKAA